MLNVEANQVESSRSKQEGKLAKPDEARFCWGYGIYRMS